MKVVLIGDSIRMGYAPLVKEKLAGKADVWGPGENCRHSAWVLEHFQQWVVDQQPDIVHINAGIHDAVSSIYEDEQPQILFDQYCLSLKRIVAAFRKNLSGKKMIWATTTPRFTADKNVPMSQWLHLIRIEEYNRAAVEIMKNEDIPIDDLHRVIMEKDYTKCLNPEDGCHMTAFGNDVLSDAVVEAILRVC